MKKEQQKKRETIEFKEFLSEEPSRKKEPDRRMKTKGNSEE